MVEAERPRIKPPALWTRLCFCLRGLNDARLPRLLWGLNLYIPILGCGPVSPMWPFSFLILNKKASCSFWPLPWGAGVRVVISWSSGWRWKGHLSSQFCTCLQATCGPQWAGRTSVWKSPLKGLAKYPEGSRCLLGRWERLSTNFQWLV